MSTIVLFIVIGGGLGWLVEMMLVLTGRPALVPPVTLPITLGVLAAVVLLLAWPVRQSVRKEDARRVDPFRATRVVLLAKASALSGALLAGVAFGILAFLATRPVIADGTSLWLSGAALLGGVLLLIGGLIAESWCTIPPDDRSDGSSTARLDDPGQAASLP
ncbi:DUF3180 domain-containing protein [Planctomonas psychrotolerans]|uniref:DUF3180 domain-containing protein n=1 Tax=Planctomonas psychrotolerans TaxID=2528712 RepID=UPI001D0CE9A5|nr:DUF3180 domain-containing protein [Planctomonas psychrotolerans]